MKFTLLMVLSFALNAHALLGGRAEDVEKDLPQLANRTTTVQSDSTGCYSVKQIISDGIAVKEYVNKSSDSVFMVRMNSRAPMAIQPLMNSSDFAEFQNAHHSVQNLNRNHKNVSTETNRLKIFVDDRQTVHRSLMILKPNVPSCVANAEALP